MSDVRQASCFARRNEAQRALHQLLKLLLVPPLDAMLAQFVPQVRSVDVVQARAVGGKEREQLVGAAGMRDVATELLSIELTTTSTAANLCIIALPSLAPSRLAARSRQVRLSLGRRSPPPSSPRSLGPSCCRCGAGPSE